MVIWQRTKGFIGWEARIRYGDSSFAMVEPDDAGGWQVRFLRGPSEPGPYRVASLAKGQVFLARWGAAHYRQVAFAKGRGPIIRPDPIYPPLSAEAAAISAAISALPYNFRGKLGRRRKVS